MVRTTRDEFLLVYVDLPHIRDTSGTYVMSRPMTLLASCSPNTGYTLAVAFGGFIHLGMSFVVLSSGLDLV